jgi:hypothetical protein
MKRAKRLIFYLLVNIIVSAATTLTVLWIWERTHPQTVIPVGSPSIETTSGGASSTMTALPTATRPPDQPTMALVEDNISVTITTIVGAGNLEAEYVEILNQSPGDVDLTAWQLVDEDGNTFVFPRLILSNSGAVKIYSKSGQKSVIELFWQSDVPIWASGEVATLLDPDENAIASYSIP